MVNLLGLMDKYMKDNLKMMFDMVKEYIDIPMVKWANLCGKKAK